MKKIICICLLLTSVLLSFAGCGASGNSNNNNNNYNNPSQYNGGYYQGNPSGNYQGNPSGNIQGNQSGNNNGNIVNSQVKPSDPSDANGNAFGSTPVPGTSAGIPIVLTVQTCKENNGFDASVAGSGDAVSAHRSFGDLFSATLSGAVKNENGSYSVPSGKTLSIFIKLLENPAELPRGEAGRMNWYVNTLCNTEYNGKVSGTNIDGIPLGIGAYYAEIAYADGSIQCFHETNIASGLKQGDIKEAELLCETDKEISSVSLVIVYQIYYEYYNWLWYKGIGDYRASGMVKFGD